MHSAFGETELFGTMKDNFAHWFSTKPFDPDTRLVQYEYRPYDGPNGRWLSKDPIGEDGGPGLYGFAGNDGVNNYDIFGLAYGDRLTKKEAQQLACAINKFLKYAPAANAIAAWGEPHLTGV